jgi:hypothetical protein
MCVRERARACARLSKEEGLSIKEGVSTEEGVSKEEGLSIKEGVSKEEGLSQGGVRARSPIRTERFESLCSVKLMRRASPSESTSCS